MKENELYVADREQWREWLEVHYSDKKVVWLIFYKKHTGQPSISYDEAVEEALCFGWIDSIIKRIDNDIYARKFTPRDSASKWSESNKKRVEKLLADGRMTDFGMAVIKAAKQNGQWDNVASTNRGWVMPPEFENALNKNRKAKQYFESLAQSYKRPYIWWIATAKRPETRERRIREAIMLLEQNKKLGMK
ncbi:MAG: YdeI/OmpD-associated family protein [Candidatus Latescibacteria bacterium]|nr:YdeI/OmpD-associated family protein [Candidatus Latescibacterota bacterium]